MGLGDCERWLGVWCASGVARFVYGGTLGLMRSCFARCDGKEGGPSSTYLLKRLHPSVRWSPRSLPCLSSY